MRVWPFSLFMIIQVSALPVRGQTIWPTLIAELSAPDGLAKGFRETGQVPLLQIGANVNPSKSEDSIMGLTQAASSSAAQSKGSSPAESRASVRAFIESFKDHHRSNDPGDWASDFADEANYCYYKGKGLADQRFIRYDRARFLNEYPSRHYEFSGPTIKIGPGDNTAQVYYTYKYHYTGTKKSADGTAHVSLTLKRISGNWSITQFEEKVERQ